MHGPRPIPTFQRSKNTEGGHSGPDRLCMIHQTNQLVAAIGGARDQLLVCFWRPTAEHERSQGQRTEHSPSPPFSATCIHVLFLLRTAELSKHRVASRTPDARLHLSYMSTDWSPYHEISEAKASERGIPEPGRHQEISAAGESGGPTGMMVSEFVTQHTNTDGRSNESGKEAKNPHAQSNGFEPTKTTQSIA